MSQCRIIHTSIAKSNATLSSPTTNDVNAVKWLNTQRRKANYNAQEYNWTMRGVNICIIACTCNCSRAADYYILHVRAHFTLTFWRPRLDWLRCHCLSWGSRKESEISAGFPKHPTSAILVVSLFGDKHKNCYYPAPRNLPNFLVLGEIYSYMSQRWWYTFDI